MAVFLFEITPEDAKVPCLKILVRRESEPEARQFAEEVAKDNHFHADPSVKKIDNVDNFQLSDNEESRVVAHTPHTKTD